MDEIGKILLLAWIIRFLTNIPRTFSIIILWISFWNFISIIDLVSKELLEMKIAGINSLSFLDWTCNFWINVKYNTDWRNLLRWLFSIHFRSLSAFFSYVIQRRNRLKSALKKSERDLTGVKAGSVRKQI